jgi:hypothetical protein
VFRIGRLEGSVRAHRFAYEELVGTIPEGLTLDHLCRVTQCVNPKHLEPVTGSENSIRAHRDKEACRHGHKYAEVGFTIGTTKGERLCNACKERNRARRSEREKAERAASPKPPKLLRDACSKGHVYTPENTYITPSTGQRACLTCKRSYKAAAYSNGRNG